MTTAGADNMQQSVLVDRLRVREGRSRRSPDREGTGSAWRNGSLIPTASNKARGSPPLTVPTSSVYFCISFVSPVAPAARPGSKLMDGTRIKLAADCLEGFPR
jgi:hypothetical protein